MKSVKLRLFCQHTKLTEYGKIKNVKRIKQNADSAAQLTSLKR